MEESNSCKNCGNTVQQNFCNYCGQRVIRDRWTIKKLSKSIVNALFNLEKGYFYTFKSMVLSPGKVIKDYLNGNTVNYTNPFRYALIGIAINTFFMLYLGVWELQIDQTVETYRGIGLVKSEADELRMREQMKFVTQFMNFIPFLIIPCISVSSLFFLRKRALYYAEHIILNTFVIGQSTLYGIIFSFAIYLFPGLVSWGFLIGFLLAGLVYSQVFKDIFNWKILKGMLIGIISYAIGFVIMMIVSMVIGIFVAIIFTIFFK